MLVGCQVNITNSTSKPTDSVTKPTEPITGPTELPTTPEITNSEDNFMLDEFLV